MSLDVTGITAADNTTKARIERGALTLFVSKGVDAVTTREIAAAAGIAEGTIYRHYQSKDALAESLFWAIHLHLTDMVRSIAHSPLELTDQVDELVSGYCHTADEDWDLFAYHLFNMTRYLPQGTRDRDGPVRATEDILRAAIQKGWLRECDVVLTSAMTLGVVLNTALTKAYGQIDGPLSGHIPAFTQAINAILRAA